MKYLGRDLIKYFQEKCTKNYKTLPRENKYDPNIRKAHYVPGSILLRCQFFLNLATNSRQFQ